LWNAQDARALMGGVAGRGNRPTCFRARIPRALRKVLADASTFAP
jgi:hypothetical protein